MVVGANLFVLAYYKYLIFFVEQVNVIFHTHIDVGNVILPIGISFYTFTQIAYLVDIYQGKTAERNFISYLLFVTYFPHLVAGPILHHSEMMPQFNNPYNIRVHARNLARGFTFFGFGLFKKVVFADGCGPIADQVFSTATQGLSTLDAWTGVMAYTLQIYYDFSGYSDMAIGISLLFNIRLPINFFSPYKARSISEFWRRWHMTLSRFLRDYLYIPLGGNRKGESRRFVNVFVTMLLGGLWHGANWTFIIWGGLHGLYLGINHSWRTAAKRLGISPKPGIFLSSAYWFLTFFAVVVSWVFFRAATVSEATSVLSPMLGAGPDIASKAYSVSRGVWLGFLLLWAFAAPNTNQVFRYYFGERMIDRGRVFPQIRWHATPLFAVITGMGLFFTAFTALCSRDSLAFLYFQF